MKKGPIVLLLVFAAFMCVMTGTLIGRHTSGNFYNINEQLIAQTFASGETESVYTEDGLLNINTATVSEIAELPGIGEVLAQRIIDYRTQNGAFTGIDDLEAVEGIGEKRIDAIREFITVGG